MTRRSKDAKPVDWAKFSSTKFELLDAMSMDPRLTGSEFRIAYRLMQHMNSETGAIFPSQDRLASQTGRKLRTVRACIEGLCKKGWLEIWRPNRQLTNRYRFLDKHVNPLLDRQTSLNDTIREERAQRRQTREAAK